MYIPEILLKSGWNRRVFTLDDFTWLCATTNVEVLTIEMQEEGFYTHYKDHPVIGIRKGLPIHRRAFVSLHEIGHHLLHHPGIACFDETSRNKAEYQANVIAACALIPERILCTKEFTEIEDALNVSRELVMFRADLWRYHKL